MVIVDKDTDIESIDFKEGAVILVDKPLTWTSFDVVNKIRYRLRHKYGLKKFKVGHNGTLDPLATGLLMIFVGKYTKLIPKEENHDKRYTGTIKLGCTTPSLDRETEECDFKPIDHISDKLVKDSAATFLGDSIQKIPIFSATKINGVAMYKLARKGESFQIKSKEVTFHNIDVTGINLPLVQFDVLCGKGTYIRAFARDLGEKLNASAYLYDLRRTQISSYSVERAVTVEEICNKLEKSEHSS